jgi:hypothetical protein
MVVMSALGLVARKSHKYDAERRPLTASNAGDSHVGHDENGGGGGVNRGNSSDKDGEDGALLVASSGDVSNMRASRRASLHSKASHLIVDAVKHSKAAERIRAKLATADEQAMMHELSWRCRIFLLFDEPSSSFAAHVFSIFIMIAILVGAASALAPPLFCAAQQRQTNLTSVEICGHSAARLFRSFV